MTLGAQTLRDWMPSVPDFVEESAATEAPLADSHAPAVSNALLTGSVGSALMWLALPVLGEQFLQLLVGLVDTYLAGTVSNNATTAIGLATTVVWLANLLFSFVGVGATALVSRHAGMGDSRRANHFSNQAISLALMMGLFECVLIYALAPVLPRFLSWGPEPTALATQYLRIDCWGYLIYSLTLIGAACLRGVGDMRTPLYIVGVVNACNILTSAALRFGFGPIHPMGVPGIALGTLVSRVLGGSITLVLLLRGRSGLQMLARDLHYHWDSVARLLRVGVPAGIDGTLRWGGQFIFLKIISSLGTGEQQSAIIAAHVVGIRVEALSYLPAFAWAIAAATLVGQNLGAANPRRAARSGHLAAAQGAGLCFLMGAIFFIFAPQIYWLFNSHEYVRVAVIGVPALRCLAFFEVPQALSIIYSNALRGAGDTRWPMLFTIIGMLIVRLPLAYVGGIVLHGGLIGAWCGMFADMLCRGILNTIRFTRGRWQHVQV